MRKASTEKAKPSLEVVQAGGMVWTGHRLPGTGLKVVQEAPLESNHLLFRSCSWDFSSCCYGYSIPSTHLSH